jgi:hypothetical protein
MSKFLIIGISIIINDISHIGSTILVNEFSNGILLYKIFHVVYLGLTVPFNKYPINNCSKKKIYHIKPKLRKIRRS